MRLSRHPVEQFGARFALGVAEGAFERALARGHVGLGRLEPFGVAHRQQRGEVGLKDVNDRVRHVPTGGRCGLAPLRLGEAGDKGIDGGVLRGQVITDLFHGGILPWPPARCT